MGNKNESGDIFSTREGLFWRASRKRKGRGSAMSGRQPLYDITRLSTFEQKREDGCDATS